MKGASSPVVSDQELAARLKIGDTDAHVLLERQYAARLLGFIRSSLDWAAREGAAADAEEILNDTFYHIIVKIDLYDPARGSLKAWSFSIAKNKIIDHSRRRGRKSELPIRRDVDVTAVADPRTNPEDTDDSAGPLQAPRMLAVREELAGLSERDRLVLELHYAAKVPDTEIARQVGVQPQSIPMLRKRARDRLKRRLATRPEFRDWVEQPSPQGGG